MKPTPKLTLRKENLTPLTREQARAVAGGATSGPQCRWLTEDSWCHSDFVECMTGLPCFSVGGC